MYYHHTGFPGGIKSINFEKLQDKAPERIIESAVKGMMPKNKLSRAMMSKLKIYAGSEHPHGAQQPVTLDIWTISHICSPRHWSAQEDKRSGEPSKEKRWVNFTAQEDAKAPRRVYSSQRVKVQLPLTIAR